MSQGINSAISGDGREGLGWMGGWGWRGLIFFIIKPLSFIAVEFDKKYKIKDTAAGRILIAHKSSRILWWSSNTNE